MMALDILKKQLESGLDELKFTHLSDDLLAYLTLLQKWNKAYNLTAIRDPSDMVTKHILDALAIAPWVYGQRVIDVGTGAGIPGIPLALAFPEKQFVLLDSNGKKIRFLNEIKRLLKINNIELCSLRVECYHPEQGFDTVVSRAFSNLAQMIRWTKHLLTAQGRWLAMKGLPPVDELQEIEQSFLQYDYRVPGLDETRTAIIIQK